jgi:hypothetical protein
VRLIIGGEVAQPAEPMQRARPGDGGRSEIERRAAVELGDLACEAEVALRDLVGEARIGGSDALRHDQQLVRHRRAVAPAHQRRAQHAGERRPPRAVDGEAGKVGLLRESQLHANPDSPLARHRQGKAPRERG